MKYNTPRIKSITKDFFILGAGLQSTADKKRQSVERLEALTRNSFQSLFLKGGILFYFEYDAFYFKMLNIFLKPPCCQFWRAQFLQLRLECMLSQTPSHGQTGKTYKKCFLQCWVNFLPILPDDDKREKGDGVIT